jgi:hypothetical protein
MVGAAILAALYAATLAPGVTLWDAGEFLAAIKTLGVPHPPGAPLFVVAAHAWATIWSPVLSFAVAVNLASAVATAVGCALIASVFARHAGAGVIMVATVMGGVASTVWLSATETEVYGWALLAMGLMLAAGDRAGRQWSVRHFTLLCFLIGLSVPLHLSALVAGPAAILLAATPTGGTMAIRPALAGMGVWLLGVGIGTVSWLPALIGVLVWKVAALTDPRAAVVGRRGGFGLLAGASFLAAMWIMATGDPAVNQGDPSTWERFWQVIGRRQYDVPGLWPRRAPAWLQVGNLLQYMDWQFGRGWSDAVGGSWRRTPLTVVLLALGMLGAVQHRARDPRTFRAMLLFVVSASLGVVAILNLRAGPSYGWGILPDAALREARERDYFFAPFFVAWGTWVACGVQVVTARVRWGTWAAVGAVAVLVWSNAATTRRDPVRGALAHTLGSAMLAGAPANAVLLVAGDNDAYATWFLQHVEAVRPDVIPVVVPLLPAGWYREELARRYGLIASDATHRWVSTSVTLDGLGTMARQSGRPIAASAAVDPELRRAVGRGGGWRFRGHIFVQEGQGLSADEPAIHRAQVLVRAAMGNSSDPDRTDPAEGYVLRLLRCPTEWFARQAAVAGAGVGLLESICNYR